MTYFVAIVRGRARRGPVAAGYVAEAPGPRTAAAEALVAEGRSRRGRRSASAAAVVGDVAGALAEAGRWEARPAPGCLLEAWGFRDPLGAAVLLVVLVTASPPCGRPEPSPN